MFALVSHYKWTLYLLNGNKGQILLLAKGIIQIVTAHVHLGE